MIKSLNTSGRIVETAVFFDMNAAEEAIPMKSVKYYSPYTEKEVCIVLHIVPRDDERGKQESVRPPPESIDGFPEENYNKIVLDHTLNQPVPFRGIAQCLCRCRMKTMRDYCSGRRIGGCSKPERFLGHRKAGREGSSPQQVPVPDRRGSLSHPVSPKTVRNI